MKRFFLTCCLLLTVLPLTAQRRWEAGLSFTQLLTPTRELWGTQYTPQYTHSLGLNGGYHLTQGLHIRAGVNLTRRNILGPAYFCATPPMMKQRVWQLGTELGVRKTFGAGHKVQPYAAAGVQAYFFGWDELGFETEYLVSLAPPVNAVMLAASASGGVRAALGARVSLDLEAGAQYGIHTSLGARRVSLLAQTGVQFAF